LDVGVVLQIGWVGYFFHVLINYQDCQLSFAEIVRERDFVYVIWLLVNTCFLLREEKMLIL